jgi:hypothetical protein
MSGGLPNIYIYTHIHTDIHTCVLAGCGLHEHNATIAEPINAPTYRVGAHIRSQKQCENIGQTPLQIALELLFVFRDKVRSSGPFIFNHPTMPTLLVAWATMRPHANCVCWSVLVV